MIEKMSFVNIMGNINDIDRVINRYISSWDIQLEYTEKELSSAANLSSCMGQNPYDAYLEKAKKLFAMTDQPPLPSRELGEQEALALVDNAEGFFQQKDEKLRDLEEKEQIFESVLKKIEPFISLNFDVASLKEFEFIRYRFGRMPTANYKQFESYVYEHSEILFLESKRDANFIYCVYFVPVSLKDKVDTMFSSLNFERIYMPEGVENINFSGTPLNNYNILKKKLSKIQDEISRLQSETLFTLGVNKQDTIDAYYTIKRLEENYDLRKYAAKTEENFYIFVGWMGRRDALKLSEALEKDKKVVMIMEEEGAATKSKVPTKLKNNPLFKPFEFFVRTYGLPKYNEIDPTPFVAITYILLFGLMFGDLGQGAVISLLGVYLNKKKNMELGGVMSIIGLSSMFFGLMYGSVFGIEEGIIPALWMRPSEYINQVLIMSVGLGAVLIFIAMILNLVNAGKERNLGRMLFSPSGIAGMVFYVAVIGMALSMFSGSYTVSAGLAVVFIGIPLAVIAFRRPLEKLLARDSVAIEGSVPMFLLETVIELFEVLLTYFTNTVSFVRVGAFALSHAGMMSVVLLLAEQSGGGYNPVVMVLGNILVMAMEGLVVGIQVLRIEFYELFSRYYEGGGRSFKPAAGSDK